MSVLAALLALFLAPDAPRNIDDIEAGFAEGNLCGLDATDHARLLADVRAMPRVELFGYQGDFVQLMDREHNLIWTFTVPGKLAYPSISCSEFGPHNGKLALRQSATCKAEDTSECAVFFELNRNRNDEVLRILEEGRAEQGQ